MKIQLAPERWNLFASCRHVMVFLSQYVVQLSGTPISFMTQGEITSAKFWITRKVKTSILGWSELRMRIQSIMKLWVWCWMWKYTAQSMFFTTMIVFHLNSKIIQFFFCDFEILEVISVREATERIDVSSRAD